MQKTIQLTLVLLAAALFSSCVSMRKYEDMEALHKESLAVNEQLSARLDRYSEDNARLRDELGQMRQRTENLREDTTHLGRQLRRLQESYDQHVLQTQHLMEGKTEETRLILARLQDTQDDLQRREDELMLATREMDEKEARLNALMAEVGEKEARVNELESILDRQDSIVQDLRRSLSNALLGFLDEGLSVDIRGGKVYVSMEERLLFATGSTQVDPQGVAALRELARVLAQNPDISIMIEGHTDDVPFRPGAAIKDNWELSVMRATAVLRILLQQGDIEPQRFIAAGRGEYHPVDPDDSPEKKKKNRRTEIILTPQLDELFQILEQH